MGNLTWSAGVPTTASEPRFRLVRRLARKGLTGPSWLSVRGYGLALKSFRAEMSFYFIPKIGSQLSLRLFFFLLLLFFGEKASLGWNVPRWVRRGPRWWWRERQRWWISFSRCVNSTFFFLIYIIYKVKGRKLKSWLWKFACESYSDMGKERKKRRTREGKDYTKDGLFWISWAPRSDWLGTRIDQNIFDFYLLFETIAFLNVVPKSQYRWRKPINSW